MSKKTSKKDIVKKEQSVAGNEQAEDDNEGSEIDYLPSEIYLLPLSERPFFPPQTLPILMSEEVWRDSIEQISNSRDQVAGLILTQIPESNTATADEFCTIGTLVSIHHPIMASGKVQFIAEGIHRFRIVRWLSDTPPYRVEVDYPQEPEYRNNEKLKAYAIAIINLLRDLMPLNPLYSDELKYFLNRFDPNDPSPLTDFAASLTTADKDSLQDILETVNLRVRMQKVLKLIQKELEVAELQVEIRQQVEDKMTKQQLHFFLREQLKTIQKELGIAKDDRTADIDRFTECIKGLTIPKQAQKRIDEELSKFGILETGSPEYAVTRNYLDVICNLPWGVYSKDRLNLRGAKRILNRDHAGLKEVKERILEFLAVGNLKGEIAGSILLFVGPPGVGKTSIGRSIANALGRKFFRFSLGGMRDDAEIKGHRRTYIGAMPGKIIQALKESETSNPVIMLDEIDKIGSSYHGDPASALLEVLDPEQNDNFLDHYLDVRMDLSRVLFICTANQIDTIPRALFDRMETIRLSGYLAQEKIEIAQKYLWPRQIEKCGLKTSQINLSDVALRKLIENYAREAGVRNLDKQLGRLARKVVMRLSNGKTKKVNISGRSLVEFLGQSRFDQEKPMQNIGVMTGLAWTSLGGTTLNIEVARVHQKARGLKLTGNLGKVMKESAEIAYSYVAASYFKSFCKDANCADYFDKSMIHLHVPEGATPKDGPSAGITIASALVSLARNEKVKLPYAMTGELTLTGHVLAVGGIREKIIAARRAGLKNLILPEACRGVYKELPDYLKVGMNVNFVKHYKEVFKILFE
ncbi:MAG: endopeptidase La [Gammaproteobacteria bacterium]|nr:MAG: endopeptidase La [Gammaproteobacteria bacterium]